MVFGTKLCLLCFGVSKDGARLFPEPMISATVSLTAGIILLGFDLRYIKCNFLTPWLEN